MCHSSQRGPSRRQHLALRAEETTAAEVVAAVSARAPLRDLTVTEPDIEDVVRRLYEP